MRIARRIRDLAQSDIRRMTRECERVGGLNLGQGICDLPTPPLVRDGAIAAIRENRAPTRSRRARGAAGRDRQKLGRDNGLRRSGDRDLRDRGRERRLRGRDQRPARPGDGVLLFEPYYGYHLNAALVAGLTPSSSRSRLGLRAARGLGSRF
jgi:aminotransferase